MYVVIIVGVIVPLLEQSTLFVMYYYGSVGTLGMITNLVKMIYDDNDDDDAEDDYYYYLR